MGPNLQWLHLSSLHHGGRIYTTPAPPHVWNLLISEHQVEGARNSSYLFIVVVFLMIQYTLLLVFLVFWM